jgi:hypothetical protein
MSASLVEQIANAVLYEGYILYPYRPSSVKNRQRWTFGGIYPRTYSEAQVGSDAWSVQAQCLVLAEDAPSIAVQARFLQLVDRQVGEVVRPLQGVEQGVAPAFRPVSTLQVGDTAYRSWQEAIERDVRLDNLHLADLVTSPRRQPFSCSAQRDLEPLREAPTGEVVGMIARERQVIEGAIEVAAEPVSGSGPARLFKVSVRVSNLTPYDVVDPASRDAALMHALISAHVILTVRGGSFVSLLDPPAGLTAAVGACTNASLWPVLVGEDGQHDTLLASPIILYDYPQIAPESPGDLFDGTEIDEILTLRILTMTDAEKAEMCQTDERARALLERTEALSAEDLMGLHGTMRSLRRAGRGGT